MMQALFERPTLRDTLEGRGLRKDLTDACVAHIGATTMMHLARIEFHRRPDDTVRLLVKCKPQPNFFGGLLYSNHEFGPYALDSDAYDVFDEIRDNLESKLFPEVMIVEDVNE